jgi:hypothetical protein
MDYGVAIIVSQLAQILLTPGLPDRSPEEESRIGLQVSHDWGLPVFSDE